MVEKKKKKPDIFELGNQNEGAGKDYCQAKEKVREDRYAVCTEETRQA